MPITLEYNISVIAINAISCFLIQVYSKDTLFWYYKYLALTLV